MADKDTKTFTFKFAGDSSGAIISTTKLTKAIDDLKASTKTLTAAQVKEKEEADRLIATTRQKQLMLLEFVTTKTAAYEAQLKKLEQAVTRGSLTETQAYGLKTIAANKYEKAVQNARNLVQVLNESTLTSHTKELEKVEQALQKIKKVSEEIEKTNAARNAEALKQAQAEKAAIEAEAAAFRKLEIAKKAAFLGGSSEDIQKRSSYVTEKDRHNPIRPGSGLTTVSAQEAKAQEEYIKIAAAMEARRLENQKVSSALELANFKSTLASKLAASEEEIKLEKIAQVSGINSLEYARTQAFIKEAALIQKRNQALKDVSKQNLAPAFALGQSEHIMETFKKGILEVNANLAVQERAFKKAAESGEFLRHTVRNIIAAYAVFVSLKNTVFNLGGHILNTGIELDSTKASLLSTLGSSAAVSNILVDLDKEAERTGVSIGVLRESFRNLSASMSLAGESSKTTFKVFTDLNTVGTALHLTSEKMQGIFLAVAQIFNKSKVQSEELVKQLGNLLPGAFAAFATANHKSTQQLSKDMKAGMVFAHDTIVNFTDFMATRFKDAFELSANNVNANIGRMQTAFIHLGETLYGQTNGAVNNTVKGITGVVNELTAVISGTSKFQTTIETTGKVLGSVLGVTLVTLFAKAIAKSTLFNTTFSLISGKNPFAVGLVGLTLLITEYSKATAAAKEFHDKAIEGAKAQKLLETPNNKALTPEQRLSSSVQLDSRVADVKKEIESITSKIQSLTGGFQGVLHEILPEGKRRMAEYSQALGIQLELYQKKVKEVRDELSAKETVTNHSVLEARIKDLSDAHQIELSFIKTEAAARELALSNYKEQNAEKLARLQEANRVLFQDIVPFRSAVQVGLTPEQLETFKQNQKAISQIEKGEFAVQEQASEAFRDKERQEAEKQANRLLQIAQKQYAAQEEALKASFTRLEEIEKNYRNKLDFQQSLPPLSLSAEALAAKKIASLDREIQLLKEQNIQYTAIEEKKRSIAIQTENEVSELPKVTGSLQKALAVIQKIESAGNPGAVSPTGAVGLRQVQPSTLASPGLGLQGIAVPPNVLQAEIAAKAHIITKAQKGLLRDFALANVDTLADFGAKYYTALVKRYKGDFVSAAAAYNEGPGNFEKYGVNNKETRNYIKNFTKEFSNSSISSTNVKASGIVAKAESSISTADSQTQQAIQDRQLQQQELANQLELARYERSKQFLSIKAATLTIENKLVEAASIQFDLDNKDKVYALQAILKDKEHITEETRKETEEALKNLAIQKEQVLLSANFEQHMQKIAELSAKLAFKDNFVDNALNQGKISEFEAIAAHARNAKAQMTQIRAEMDAISADVSLNAADKASKLASMSSQLGALQTQAEGVETYFRTRLAGAFENVFTGFANHALSASDAAKQLALAVVQMFEEIVIKALAAEAATAAVKIIGMLFNTGGSVGGTSTGSVNTSAISNIASNSNIFSFPGAAEGRAIPSFTKTKHIKGKGTSTSDDILSAVPLGSFILNAKATKLVRLSNGELFIEPEKVKEIGVDKLQQLNDIGKYASGGYLGTPLSNRGNVIPFARDTSGTSMINHILVNVNHTGKESASDLGNKVGDAVSIQLVKKIAEQVASSKIAVYDKSTKHKAQRQV